MHAYVIAAVTLQGARVIATSDTAGAALEQLEAALEQYPRAWVSDETGADVSLAELTIRASQERLR